MATFRDVNSYATMNILHNMAHGAPSMETDDLNLSCSPGYNIEVFSSSPTLRTTCAGNDESKAGKSYASCLAPMRVGNIELLLDAMGRDFSSAS